MTVTAEVIQALATLRGFALHGTGAWEAGEAVDILDNAGVFREVDEQTGYDIEGKD